MDETGTKMFTMSSKIRVNIHSIVIIVYKKIKPIKVNSYKQILKLFDND